MHRLGVTVVLDRAGVTGPDGPSHHGMWDLAVAAMTPGIAAGRAPGCADAWSSSSPRRWTSTTARPSCATPKGAVPAPLPALRRVGGVDVLAEPPADAGHDVLLVAVGTFCATAVDVAGRLTDQGIGVTVVDPRWALPVPDEIGELARHHRLVVTVEDGGRSGGVGAAVVDALSGTGVPVRVFALPQEFLPAGTRDDLLVECGLTTQAIARGITETIAALERQNDDQVHPVAER